MKKERRKYGLLSSGDLEAFTDFCKDPGGMRAKRERSGLVAFGFRVLGLGFRVLGLGFRV